VPKVFIKEGEGAVQGGNKGELWKFVGMDGMWRMVGTFLLLTATRVCTISGPSSQAPMTNSGQGFRMYRPTKSSIGGETTGTQEKSNITSKELHPVRQARGLGDGWPGPLGSDRGNGMSGRSKQWTRAPLRTMEALVVSTPAMSGEPSVAVSSFVNVSLGRTARLRCETFNVPNVSVSWIRHREGFDLNLLTVNDLVYTQDSRVSIHVSTDQTEWELEIREIREDDGGEYQCQVNTNPLSQLVATLSVIKSFTEITGDQELFMAENSFLNLSCIVHSPERPVGLFWRHEEKLLSTSSDGVSVVVSPVGRRDATSSFLSSLRLWLGSQEQSGRYHCIPTNTPQASVLVHVLDGETLRAMYSNCGSRSLRLFGLWLLLVLASH